MADHGTEGVDEAGDGRAEHCQWRGEQENDPADRGGRKDEPCVAHASFYVQ